MSECQNCKDFRLFKTNISDGNLMLLHNYNKLHYYIQSVKYFDDFTVLYINESIDVEDGVKIVC